MTSPLLSRWAIDRDGDRRVLDVRLREPTVQMVVLNLSATRTPPLLEKWTFPKLEPLDVVGQVAVVGLLAEGRLSAQSLDAHGMIAVDTAVLQTAIAAGALGAEPGAPPLRSVVAYYAPQGDFRLAGAFVRPPAELAVTTNVLLSLGDREQGIRGGFLLVPKVDRLFGFDFSVPDGWHMMAVTGADNKPLAFERFDAPGKSGRIRVRLPAGSPPGKDCRVYFQAAATPDAWLGTWQSIPVAFPKFAVAGATRDQGALAVVARDDMVVRPEKLHALTPLDETEKPRYGLGGVPTNLAYRYEGQDYQAALVVERTRPRLTARTISFFHVESDALTVHAELIYQIEEARSPQLRLSLPADTPAALSIHALDGVRLKEFTSELAGDRRRWDVLLEQPRRGTVRLAVDFQQPVPENKLREIRVPIVRAEGVAYQTGLVAVEGSAELDVQVSTEPTTRRVDVGELVDASYQPGRRLLGVWEFVGDPPPVKVSATRNPGYGLYPAIVQKAELSTVLSPDGVAQTSALFQLRTKALYLEVVLPGDSELWSILVDNKPVKPQSEQGRLLVSLPAAPANQTRSLKLVYETPILTVPIVGQVKMPAPKLLLRTESGGVGRPAPSAAGSSAPSAVGSPAAGAVESPAAIEVPLADLVWHLFLPSGYEVIRADGTVVGELHPPEVAALNVAKVGLGALAANVFPISGSRKAWRQEALLEASYSDRGRGRPKSAMMLPPASSAEPAGAMSVDDEADPFSQDGPSKTPLSASRTRAIGAKGEIANEERVTARRHRVNAEGQSKDNARPGMSIAGRPARAPTATTAPAPPAVAMPQMKTEMGQRIEEPVEAMPGSMPGMMGGMGGMGGAIQEEEQAAPSAGYGGGYRGAGVRSGIAPGGTPVLTPALPEAPAEAKPADRKDALVRLGETVVGRPSSYKPRTEGLSSLQIDLQTSTEVDGQAVTFASLGESPELVVTLANRPRLAALGWAIALTIGLIGVARTNRTIGAKTRLILWVMVLGTLVPLVPYGDTLTQPANMAVYAAGLLVPYYLLAGLLKWLATGLHHLRVRLWKPAATAAAILLVAVCHGLPTRADEPAKSGPYVIEVVGPPEPVKIPDDIVILPYDPDSKTGIQDAQRVLVPYAKYVELWNLAHPDKRLGEKAPPAPFALANSQYTTTLQGEDFLALEGQLEIDIFSDQFVDIPLSLEGGALARAELDGKPAQIRVTQPAPPPANAPAPNAPPANVSPQQAAPAPAVTPAAPIVVVNASGKGRHKLQVTVRLRLERRGGWRSAEGVLPVASANALTLHVPQAQTEVRLSQVADRKSYETAQPGQTIETAIGLEGRVAIQWRPKVGEAQVDRSLTAQSDAVLDVQEDGIRAVWQVGLEFRRSQRESFRLYVPGDYLVEKVEGPNVRGWELRKEANRQTVDVTLLKAAKDNERFTLRLWHAGIPAPAARAADKPKTGPVEPSPRGFDCPLVRVADAALESGRLTIRRSPLLDVETIARTGATRIDLAEKAAEAAAAGAEDSPLGIRPYEAYQFSTMPFSVRLSAVPVAGRVTANVETVLKVAAYERSLESRVRLDVRDRPIHRVEVFLPNEFKLEQVSAPGDYQWTITQVDHRPLLTILLAAGRTGEVPVVLRGTLGSTGAVDKVPLPRLEVRSVERQEGDIAVQADPVFDIKPAELENCESVLRDQLRAWLKPEQTTATTLALHYSGPAYRGALLVAARKPDISCDTITNVRVTDRAVEETILLDFTIQQAGTRQLVFQLPAWMRDSRIQSPMLRQKTIEPTGPQADAPVRVRLDLQDEVMNKLRVLVENDRLLAPQRFSAPIPVVESGATQRQFVALQGAGRDELIVEPSPGSIP